MADWGGASVDAGRRIAFLNLNYLPWVVRMTPREQAIAQGMVPRWEGKGPLPPDAAFGPDREGRNNIARSVGRP